MTAGLLAKIFSRPWLIDEEKAYAILSALGQRVFGGPISGLPHYANHVAFGNGRPSAGIIGDSTGRRFDARGILPFDMINGIAVIPIEGTLVYKGGYVGALSGATSYQGLQAQIRRAAASPAVKGVVFEVDSFGGEASGAFETAAEIAALSRAKPTISILTDFALSAGYLLASGARQIVMPEFGEAGSIGVVMMHTDYSRQMANEGVQVTIIASGKYKAEGNSLSPLPPETRAEMQAIADAMRSKFAAAVASNRGSRLTYDAAMATEGKRMTGQVAKDAGLVDAIADPNTTFWQFVSIYGEKK